MITYDIHSYLNIQNLKLQNINICEITSYRLHIKYSLRYNNIAIQGVVYDYNSIIEWYYMIYIVIWMLISFNWQCETHIE